MIDLAVAIHIHRRGRWYAAGAVYFAKPL